MPLHNNIITIQIQPGSQLTHGGEITVFVIRLNNGREIRETDGDQLSVNQDTGVVTITRVDGFEEVTTHYSPTAWEMVTYRVKDVARRPPVLSMAR
jgi:hypothetical protein